jgi:hypothetical protein
MRVRAGVTGLSGAAALIAAALRLTACNLADGLACGADTQNDPANCGACGHDCAGGSCSAGVCQPLDSVPGIDNAIAQSGDNVWAVDHAGNLFVIPKSFAFEAGAPSGMPPPDPVVATPTQLPRVAMGDDGYLYFTVYSVDAGPDAAPNMAMWAPWVPASDGGGGEAAADSPADGTGADAHSVDAGPDASTDARADAPADASGDAHDAAATDAAPTCAALPLGGIYRAPLDGGRPARVALALGPSAVAVAGGVLAWTQYPPTVCAPLAAGSGVSYCTLQPDGSCSPAQSVSTTAMHAYDVGLVNSDGGVEMYWPTDGVIQQCSLPKGGGPCSKPAALAANNPNLVTGLHFAFDVPHGFFYVSSSSVVAACRLPSGPCTTLDADQFNPQGLALDDAHVFWTAQDGTIRSTPLLDPSTTLVDIPWQSERIVYLERAHDMAVDSPFAIAVDDRFVFWTDKSYSTLRRYPKP